MCDVGRDAIVLTGSLTVCCWCYEAKFSCKRRKESPQLRYDNSEHQICDYQPYIKLFLKKQKAKEWEAAGRNY